MNLNSILNFFNLPSVPRQTEEEKQKRIRKAVAISDTGNILLQFGHYITSVDISSLKEKLKKNTQS